MPPSQLLVQDASQDGGQQQDGPADRRVVRGDQAVRHEGHAALGRGCITCVGEKSDVEGRSGWRCGGCKPPT